MYDTDLRTFWCKTVEIGQGVSIEWAKNFESLQKFRIFHHFETLRPYISETINNRGISAAYGKKLYLSPIQLSHVLGPIGHGVLQGEPKSE